MAGEGDGRGLNPLPRGWGVEQDPGEQPPLPDPLLASSRRLGPHLHPLHGTHEARPVTPKPPVLRHPQPAGMQRGPAGRCLVVPPQARVSGDGMRGAEAAPVLGWDKGVQGSRGESPGVPHAHRVPRAVPWAGGDRGLPAQVGMESGVWGWEWGWNRVVLPFLMSLSLRPGW